MSDRGTNRRDHRAIGVGWVSLLAVALAAFLIAGCGGSDSPQDAANLSDPGAETTEPATELSEEDIAYAEDLRRQELEDQAGVSEGDAPAPSGSLGNYITRRYTSEDGGWIAEVPTGGGWGSGVEKWLNPGLHRTTFDGPDGSILIIDSTPEEAPAYSGNAIRKPFEIPGYSGVEKIVFRGNTTVTPCETANCVDFLIPLGDVGGGFGVLVGGPADFAQVELLGETVASTIQPLGTP